ncbi:signal peptidase I [Clostridium sp. YIM B02551]|uniref:signal peptidase I n=1 Tax=Clostridium sp. YIM B02551 TaxID=2910679 RepID=UPI001EEB1130|nr:signal peptidase I [Clostridium sp. YIM B02551]
MKKFLKIVENVVLCILIILSIISVGSFISSKISKDTVPGIGNVKFLSVLSDSMTPTFKAYDLIIDIETPIDKLKSGDVITFKKSNTLVTHRIVDVQSNNSEVFYKTKGDANNVEDEKLVNSKDVVGKYKFKLPYMGLIITIFKGPIALGVIWILILYVIIKETTAFIKEKNKKLDGDKYIEASESEVINDTTNDIDIN